MSELHNVFTDSAVHGVMAARGGYGCLRVIDGVDIALLGSTQKPLIGFSDISLMLNQVVHQARRLCFHGPVVTSLCDCTASALERLYSCLTGNWQRAISPAGLEILRSANSETSGRLIGGNLSTLVTVLGTPYDFSWQGCILLLEDIGEPIYKIDRMLTQLYLSGKLSEPAGIILGDFTLHSDQQGLEKIHYTEFIWHRVLTLTANTGIPVWGNFPAGHCQDNLTLPLGATAVMNCSRGELQFR